jgi:hypothetical protein
MRPLSLVNRPSPVRNRRERRNRWTRAIVGREGDDMTMVMVFRGRARVHATATMVGMAPAH